MHEPTHQPDAWSPLRRHTEARIALGRAGGSVPTRELLDFSAAHAAARDAVLTELDPGLMETSLEPVGLPVIRLETQVNNRKEYLLRPDLGRRLDPRSATLLKTVLAEGTDVVLILADGLSAPAAQRQAPQLVTELVQRLREFAIGLGPLCVIRQARVAVQDEIGASLGAKLAVILIGERPGLNAANSLGAYLVFGPKVGRTDAERNCVSNIRPGGLTPGAAADTLCHLIRESLRRQMSGVGLKDERPLVGINVPQRKSIRDIKGSEGL